MITGPRRRGKPAAHADDARRIDKIIRAGAEPEQIAPAVLIGDPLGELAHGDGIAGADVDRSLGGAERGVDHHAARLLDIEVVANLRAARQLGGLAGPQPRVQVRHQPPFVLAFAVEIE